MTAIIGPLVIIALVLALVLIWVSLTLARNQEGRQSGWGLWTRYFLVLLRLSIGWHFLVEGLEKLHSSSWSSEAYLQEATGPLAPWYRELAGERLVTQLTPSAQGRLPEILRVTWQNYFDAFSDHYQLSEEQKIKADTVFRQAESKAVTWMTSESKPITKPQPQGQPLTVAMTVPERLEYLQTLDNRLAELESEYRPTFGKDTFAKMKDVKAEAKRVRSELKSDLAGQTAAMKAALQTVLTPKQKEMDPPPNPELPIAAWSRLDWADAVVKYGLFTVGVCLLAGLLTRLACVGGATFLLLFFLAMPPLPGWPESPRVEGHYLYINKNIIEMLALLALATTRSGRWAGLDGLLQFLSPRRWRATPPELYNLSNMPEGTAVKRRLDIPSPIPKEIAHGP